MAAHAVQCPEDRKMNKKLQEQIATHLWKSDGRPEFSGATTVGRQRYRDVSAEVLTAIDALGYTLTRRKKVGQKQASSSR